MVHPTKTINKLSPKQQAKVFQRLHRKSFTEHRYDPTNFLFHRVVAYSGLGIQFYVNLDYWDYTTFSFRESRTEEFIDLVFDNPIKDEIKLWLILQKLK